MMDNVFESYLADPQRLAAAADYLRHEAGKTGGRLYRTPADDIADRTSPRHRAVVERLREALAGCTAALTAKERASAFWTALPIEERWLLLHAVSFGCLEKRLENCVGHPGYGWALEAHPLSEMLFESDIGPLHGLRGDDLRFATVVVRLRVVGGEDRDPHVLEDPLIGRVFNGAVQVHDGNGRLLSSAYRVRDGSLPMSHHVPVWVGRPRSLQPLDAHVRTAVSATLFATGNAPVP